MARGVTNLMSVPNVVLKVFYVNEEKTFMLEYVLELLDRYFFNIPRCTRRNFRGQGGA